MSQVQIKTWDLQQFLERLCLQEMAAVVWWGDEKSSFLALILTAGLIALTNNFWKLLSRCPEDDRIPAPLPGLQPGS